MPNPERIPFGARGSGYYLYDSGGMASCVPLSSGEMILRRIRMEGQDREYRKSEPNIKKIRQEIREQLKKGDITWATRKPIY